MKTIDYGVPQPGKIAVSVSALPMFSHRRVAGDVQPSTGDDAGMVRGGSMALGTRKKVFQKYFRQRFPKSTSLDIKG